MKKKKGEEITAQISISAMLFFFSLRLIDSVGQKTFIDYVVQII